MTPTVGLSPEKSKQGDEKDRMHHSRSNMLNDSTSARLAGSEACALPSVWRLSRVIEGSTQSSLSIISMIIIVTIMLT